MANSKGTRAGSLFAARHPPLARCTGLAPRAHPREADIPADASSAQARPRSGRTLSARHAIERERRRREMLVEVGGRAKLRDAIPDPLRAVRIMVAGQHVPVNVGKVQREKPDNRWNSAAFARWHRGSRPESVGAPGEIPRARLIRSIGARRPRQDLSLNSVPGFEAVGRPLTLGHFRTL
jgi:hypothetical protein